MKFSGIVLNILGVIALLIHQIKSETSNSLLVVGISLMLLGLVFFILINKFAED
jgi:hypothetical protein